MTSAEVMRAILQRESLPPTKVSQEMGHTRTYLNTLMSGNRECRLGTLIEFCESTEYELIVRSKNDGYEFGFSCSSESH